MKKNTTLLDEHIESLAGMREAETDAFFYTRLKAKMEKLRGKPEQILPLKPVWVIWLLAGLLVFNGFILANQIRTRKAKSTNSYSIQNFAESYDQALSSM
jgi:hypothetical protein